MKSTGRGDIMTLNKRIKKTFIEHRASYIGIIILIILSTACYLSMKTAAVSIRQNVKQNRIDQKVEDANFKLSEKISEEEEKSIENKYNLTIQENTYYNTKYKKAFIKIVKEAKEINLPLLDKGKYLSDDNDIMIDNFYMNANKVKIGDKITLDGKDYKICGTFTTPDTLSLLSRDTDMMADGSKFGYFMITEKAFNELSSDKKTSNYSVIFNEKSTDKFKNELSQKHFISSWQTKSSNKRITTFDGESDTTILISKIAPLFLFSISMLIMAIVIARMLRKEYTYIGTLSALGYKNRKILNHYLMLPIIITLIGSLLGLGLGLLLVKPMRLMISVEYNIPRSIFYIKWYDVVTVLLIPVILNIISAGISILSALSKNIVTLLKSNAGNIKKGLLTKLIPYRKGSFKLRFKLKETTSNLPRSFLLLVGTIAASIFMMTGFVFFGCVDFMLDKNEFNAFNYSNQYIFNTPQIENKTDGEPFSIYEFEYLDKGKPINVAVLGSADNTKYIKLQDTDGNDIPHNKTVIPRSVAKRLKLKKGDTITLRNNSDAKEHKIKIDSVSNLCFGNNIYMPAAKLNSLIGIPENAFNGLYSDHKLDIDNNLLLTSVSEEEGTAGVKSAINAFRSFLYILAAFAAVIGIIVIYIVTTMIVEENRKNISMLKVVGYKNNEISRLMLRSGSYLVVGGFLLAIPLTLTLTQMFFDGLMKSMFYYYIASIKLVQLLISFAFILIVYYLTLFKSKKKVMNVNMAESLKARE